MDIEIRLEADVGFEQELRDAAEEDVGFEQELRDAAEEDVQQMLWYIKMLVTCLATAFMTHELFTVCADSTASECIIGIYESMLKVILVLMRGLSFGVCFHAILFFLELEYSKFLLG